MIRAMVIREIQSRYIGTVGGLVWSIIHPLMTVIVYWFVFSVGFRVKPQGNAPFIIVFLCGLIPWFMFTEALITSAGAISANSHLVTKTVFPTEILPVVYLFTSLVTHCVMLIILVVVLLCSSVSFSFYNFQFLYYLFALSVFSLGLSWFFSAVNIFYKDIGQTLSVVLNMWFWFTPIVWPLDMIPNRYQSLVKLNPVYYIVEGYRSSFIYHLPLWHNYRTGLYFWAVCISVLAIGAFTFKKLKPEFAEVL
jgi:lipopolysaccharide transport system permease protein/teichoic acid transport system permease protein